MRTNRIGQQTVIGTGNIEGSGVFKGAEAAMSFIHTNDRSLEEDHVARIARRIPLAKERGTLARGERFVSLEENLHRNMAEFPPG